MSWDIPSWPYSFFEELMMRKWTLALTIMFVTGTILGQFLTPLFPDISTFWMLFIWTSVVGLGIMPMCFYLESIESVGKVSNFSFVFFVWSGVIGADFGRILFYQIQADNSMGSGGKWFLMIGFCVCGAMLIKGMLCGLSSSTDPEEIFRREWNAKMEKKHLLPSW
ncbi:MAG: hypothetical protein ACHQHP_06245 [Bacteroidia bacterium]